MLTVMLKDEYKTRAEYQALVNEFGEVTPFVNLIKAETDNIALYKAFLEKYLPTNAENVFTHLMNAPESHLSIFEDYRDGKTNDDCDPVLNTQSRQNRRNR